MPALKINKEKYKAVILFLANKIQNCTLGKVKLMKLLYYADFDFFEKTDKSITNDVYVRLPLGPVPQNAEEIIDEMVSDGLIKIERQRMSVGMNDRLLIIPLKGMNLALLSKEEIEMLENVSQKWEKFSGNEMRDASHGEAPWIATKPNCIIDYNLAYYRNKYDRMKDM